MAEGRGHGRSAGDGADEYRGETGHREYTVRLPSLADVRENATPERVLWYGGLGTLAALGVIEWPVAAVVGAGTYVARRMARNETDTERQQQGG